MKKWPAIALFVLLIVRNASAQQVNELTSGHRTSLRGLSVVNDNVAWVSGSEGWFGLTRDHGKTWKWKQLGDYAKFDFRDIEAFSEKSAIMVNAGSPAVILKTDDGGDTWKEVYRNNSPDIFLDGMDFWNKKSGLIFGDPIKGAMQLLRTSDGGNTWSDLSRDGAPPVLVEGEASFAASGTTIRIGKNGTAWIATGGKRSRVFFSSDKGTRWSSADCPMIQGIDSQGPFSIAFYDSKNGVAVGGDYKRDTLREKNTVLTNDGGKTWYPPRTPTFGYRSAVEYLTMKKLVATGTSGTDMSLDGGLNWKSLGKDAFNCVRKAKKGSWVLLAGGRGRVAELKL